MPWLDRVPPYDIADLDGIVNFVKKHQIASENGDLAEALARSLASVATTAAPVEAAAHILCAQAMLEMAVEWRMPAVERWAVAWLGATGGTHLRLRWSSRARDGRFRREAQASGPIVSIGSAADRAVLGLASGAVENWTRGGGLQPLLPPTGSPVWALAVRDGWIVAGGPRNACVTHGWSPGPPRLPPPIRGQKAAAIGSGGEIALGDEQGRLLMWVPGDSWVVLRSEAEAQVQAVTFAEGSARRVRAVWSSGEVSQLPTADGMGSWRPLHHFGADVRAAAWSKGGRMLAVAVGWQVWLVSPSRDGDVVVRRLWNQEGVHALAWSATDVLTSASLDQIHSSAGPVSAHDRDTAYKSITSDELIDAIAVVDDEHVIAVRGEHLVQWELNGAGSDDPTFYARDPITAVGLRPGDRRVTLVGTERGRLQAYDATGVLTSSGQLPHAPKIKQLAWYAEEAGWCVASLDGVYLYWPDEREPAKLASGLCHHVAAGGGRFAYAVDNQVVTSEPRTLSLPSLVTGLHIDALAGTLAAIDDDGHVLVHRPGEELARWPDETPGTKLLGVNGSRLLVHDPGGGVRWTGRRGDRRYGQLPVGLSDAAPFDAERIVVAYRGQGILLAGASPGGESWASASVDVLAASPGRIVVASANHLAGYDVLAPPYAPGDGSLVLRARTGTDGFLVTLPAGEMLELSGEALSKFEGVPGRVHELSEAVFQAGRIGDLLWQGGLDLAIDHARGQDPNRPVRLKWCFPSDDPDVDRVPWELLHPSAAPLGWFDEPTTTAVRMVTPMAAGRAHRVRGFVGSSPSMLVVRGMDPELDDVDSAFDRFRRRTRRTDVRLARARPQPVGGLRDLAEALANPVDIIQLWAHSSDEGVRFSGGTSGGLVETAALADRITQTPPKLAVLVGCRSGTLGRALVERGVLAAVAMRVPLYDHTIQPLVEDVTAAVLAGVPVDLAFAGALRRYLLTGQPGAAAIPMLYLADDFDGVLFTDR